MTLEKSRKDFHCLGYGEMGNSSFSDDCFCSFDSKRPWRSNAANNRGVTATVNLLNVSQIRAAALVFVDYQNIQIENPKTNRIR